jgi:hypothetical protein
VRLEEKTGWVQKKHPGSLKAVGALNATVECYSKVIASEGQVSAAS